MLVTYFETSTLILLWTAFYSLMLTWLSACYQVAYVSVRKIYFPPLMLWPAALIAPAFIVLMFRLFKFNAIYPIVDQTSLMELLARGSLPGLVLFVGSGLAWKCVYGARSEAGFWRGKAFFKFASALGLERHRHLVRLVVLRSLVLSWTQCFPWILSELLIVEVFFNAPGLGLQLVHLALQRSVAELIHPLMALIVLYGAVGIVLWRSSRWIGVKLESYV